MELSGRDREREEPWGAKVAYPFPFNTWSRLVGKWKLRVGRKGRVSRLAGPTPLLAPLHIMVNSCMSLPLVASDERRGLVKFSVEKFSVEAWERFVSKLNVHTPQLSQSVDYHSGLGPFLFTNILPYFCTTLLSSLPYAVLLNSVQE
jgi:hypothetical protein